LAAGSWLLVAPRSGIRDPGSEGPSEAEGKQKQLAASMDASYL